MTTDRREHEAGDEILLAGSLSKTVGEWRHLLALPAAASCDIAHLHPVTLQLTGLYSWMLQAATPPSLTQTCLAMHL